MKTLQSMMNLKGRRALITGAAGGLGAVMVDALAEMGADLILVDRPGVNFDELVEITQARWGVEVSHYHCDLEQHDQRTALFGFVKEHYSILNILINNAAFVGASDLKGWAVPYEKQTIESWRRALEVNLTAPFHLVQGFTKIMRESPGASIMNIGSIYGEYGPDWRMYESTEMSNPAAYAASKGGLLQLTRWLSTTLAPLIRVNAISPGGVSRNQPETFVKQYESRTPLGRMASPEDFRGVVAYLASDLSQYVTGQVITVDGGWGVW
jgi:NAD(P)-dependent dehydrogenase (short-subunit alcohol dehydrogenase family)